MRKLPAAAWTAMLLTTSSTAWAQAGFVLTDHQHLDVIQSYVTGVLWDNSTADVWKSGYIAEVFIHNSAHLGQHDFYDGIAFTNIMAITAFDTGSIAVTGGGVGSIDAHTNSTVDITGGEATSVRVYGTSHAEVSGGNPRFLHAFDQATIDVSGGYDRANSHL